MKRKDKTETANDNEAKEKIHLVFQEADAAVLKQAIELDDALQGEVWLVRDDYAVGPIENLYETDGYQQRRNWWRQLIEASPYKADEVMNLVDDRLLVHRLINWLQENENGEAWIWMGQNAHDVCGYYWLIGQLKAFQGRIVVLYLNNLPFINEKGQIFYPTALHQIQPKEFLKAKKLNRKVTQSEFELDPDEWKRLSAENALVRVLEGGKKMVSKDEDFFDKEILNNLGTEVQKGNRAIQNILSKMKIKTGDVFLLWRLRKLAEAGMVEIQGDPSKSWKDFEVKLKAAPAETAEAVTTNDQNQLP